MTVTQRRPLPMTSLANLPPGTTREQLNEMIQNLVKERFHMTFHHTTKDFDASTLVEAKGGPKLQEAAVLKTPRAVRKPEHPRNRNSTSAAFP